jgi:hypothetical protein
MAGGIAGLAVLYLLLVLPAYTDEFSVGKFLRLPVELPVLLLVLFAVPVGARRWTRRAAALCLGMLVALKVANLTVFAIYARPFNAFLHLHLVPAGVQLLSGAVGPVLTSLAIMAAFALLGFVGAILFGALRAVVAAFEPWRPRLAVAAAVFLLVGYGILDVADVRAQGEATTTATSSSFMRDQLQWHWQTFGDLERFRADLAEDDQPSDRLLSGLGKTDVLLVFVESYGRTAIETPSYAAVTGLTLQRFDAELKKAGFEARSAWLASSTFGGQSWLAHSTLLSGLRIDGQGRYDALVLSRRQLLIHDFRRAGWSTVAVVPGITGAWPDAQSFGYERVHAAADLGYAGLPFGWIPMPDQYTLAALDRLELAAANRPPIMATVVLISSHAPWTPIPVLAPWEQIGDGAVFGPAMRTGDDPDVVWTDAETIRAQYIRSIDYVLQTLAAYVAKHTNDDMLMIVVGDHQPIPFVAGDTSRPDVPVHIIARDRSVLAAMEDWGWTSGMTPGPAAPTWPMEALRGRLLATFTPDVATAAAPSEGEGSP